jgi:hypothetical protein
MSFVCVGREKKVDTLQTPMNIFNPIADQAVDVSCINQQPRLNTTQHQAPFITN